MSVELEQPKFAEFQGVHVSDPRAAQGGNTINQEYGTKADADQTQQPANFISIGAIFLFENIRAKFLDSFVCILHKPSHGTTDMVQTTLLV